MPFKEAERVISPLIRRNAMIASLTPQEKSEIIKAKYGLTHGNGKRKRKTKK